MRFQKAKLLIPELESRLKNELPKAGEEWRPTKEEREKVSGDLLSPYRFDELPITDRTLTGLKNLKLTNLTKIQALCIPHALAGRDLLGEAPTGSGKTMCFLVPVLENLFRDNWTYEDGVGALILTPTRELSQQIFDGFTKFRNHELGAMAVYGGKRLLKEQKMIHKASILIGTPGRVKEHLESTANLTTENMKMLVLDEADKLIELGFLADLEAIADNIPPPSRRQTVLYSATLPASVRRLAKQFCKSSVQYVNAGAGEAPSQLTHVYCSVLLEDKLSAVFSFLCRNFRQKIIVFVSSVKQARFLFEAFNALKTGARILEIHASHDQAKRLQTFDEFATRRAAITLIATDLVGRGVDFPAVDWVIQMDCPPDVETYIHRVGRTARGLESKGHGVLLLMPSEMEFVKRVREKRIDLKQVKIKPDAAYSITSRLRNLCAQRPDVRHLATRAFQTYYKSQFVMADKSIFKFASVYESRDQFAASLGLPMTPELDFDATRLFKKKPSLSSLTTTADEDESPQIGGVDKDEEAALQKNRSRLQKLKEKIAAKKASKVVAEPVLEMDSDEEKTSKREKRRQKLLNLRASKTAELAQDDDLLVNVEVDRAPAEPEDWRQSDAVQRALQKNRLVIRADGTAKFKGAAGLIKAKHVFFDDDVAGYEADDFAGLVASMQNREESSDSEDDVMRGLSEREKFILKTQRRIEAQRKEAKRAERDRRREERRLRREKSRPEEDVGVVMEDDDEEAPPLDESDDDGTPRATFLDDLSEDEDLSPSRKKSRLEDLESAALKKLGVI